MATYTENYNLEKPAQSDLYNIDVFNENADKIDEALGDKAENQSLAPIESSAAASRNYSVGQQFVYNGLLYEATAAIASGGTITPGSNCARTTVAEELSALNNSLTNSTAPIDIRTQCTFSTNMRTDASRTSIYVIGKLLYISMRFETVNALNQYDNIIALPSACVPHKYGASVIRDTTASSIIQVYSNQDSAIQIGTAIPANHVCTFMMMLVLE